MSHLAKTNYKMTYEDARAAKLDNSSFIYSS